MAFKTLKDLAAAMDYFKDGNVRLFPTASLVDEFFDDHLPCYKIDFGGVFEYTFWYAGSPVLFDIARVDISYEAAKDILALMADSLAKDDDADAEEYDESCTEDASGLTRTKEQSEQLERFRIQFKSEG